MTNPDEWRICRAETVETRYPRDEAVREAIGAQELSINLVSIDGIDAIEHQVEAQQSCAELCQKLGFARLPRIVRSSGRDGAERLSIGKL
jgi:hypothetical protein